MKEISNYNHSDYSVRRNRRVFSVVKNLWIIICFIIVSNFIHSEFPKFFVDSNLIEFFIAVLGFWIYFSAVHKDYQLNELRCRIEKLNIIEDSKIKN